jgi:chromosome partitioning protein
MLTAAQTSGAQFVIIDTPPRVEQAALAAARVATLVLIPCRPAIFDLDTVSTTLELLSIATPAARAAVILNGTPPAGDECAQTTRVLHELGLVVCPTSLGYRKAFAQSAAAGQTALEFAPTSRSADEIRSVYRFVNRLLKGESAHASPSKIDN